MPPKKTTEATIQPQEKVFHTQGGEVLIDSSIPEKQQKEIQELYVHATKLSEDPAKNESAYAAILKSVKGSEKAKQLASTLIPKYIKYFPGRSQEAIDAVLDLCDDDTREVRISSIRGLPQLCKDENNLNNVQQIGAVLFQLVLAEDSKELEVVNWAIQEILNIDPEASLKALFTHIGSKEDLVLREKCLEFLKTKIIAIEALMKVDKIQKLVDSEIKKILGSASQKEFLDFVGILMTLPGNKNQEVAKTLFTSAVAKSGLDKVNPSDKVALADLYKFMHGCIPLVQNSVSFSTPFFAFFVKSVLPVLEKYDDREKLSTLRTMAEMSKYTSSTDSRQYLAQVYALLLKYLPLKNKEGEKEPFLNFSNIECLLYMFVQLANKAPGALNPVCGIKINTGQPQDDIGDYKEKLDDLKARLSFCKDQAGNIRKNSKDSLLALEKEFKTKTEKTEEDKATLEAARLRSTNVGKLMTSIILLTEVIKKASFTESGDFYTSWQQVPPKPEGKKENPKESQKENPKDKKKPEKKDDKKRKNEKKDKPKKKKKTEK